MDRIRWINHAGFELQSSGLRIICDPWLTGFAFANSWSLLSETKFKPSDFAGVDYIWISHEHPDHFSPPDLRSIPKHIRTGITVLFQRTLDRRVVKFCENLGFRIKELGDWERTDLSNGVFMTVKTVGDDSLCLIETPRATYLNVNDCVASNTESLHREIAAKIPKVDVLLTQFSFANWAGNPGELSIMRAQAQQKVDDIATQVAIHKPSTLIPFASYVWYCRPDNFHLNAGSNRIRDVYYKFRNDGCVVLYPDDILEVGGQHDSSQALAAYAIDEAKHAAPLYLKELRYTPEELDALSELLQRDMRSKNWMWLLQPLQFFGYLKPVAIYLTDIDRSLTYSMLSGIVWTDAGAADADICFVSAAMAQMLTHGSGYDTLYISGRFVERRPGSRFHLSRNFFVSRQNEHDRFFPSSFLNFAYIRRRFGN